MMGILQRMTDTLRGRSPSGRPSLDQTDANERSKTMRTGRFSFEDYLEMEALAFEWADSYDCKDPVRLTKILAPNVHVDYTEVNGNEYTSMPSEQFVNFMFHPGFVGDPLVNTQHLLGATKFVQVSDDEVHAFIQIRAAHQRYTGPDKQTVENKGHGHAMIRHTYVKIEGVWKFAGLRPEVRWNEFAFDKIFVHFDPSAVMEPSAVDMNRVTKLAAHVRAEMIEPGSIEVP